MCLLPEELTLEGRDPPPRHPGSLYAISLKSIYPFVIAAAPLEIAMAAFDAFLTLACHKTPGSGSVVRRDKPIVRAMIGRLSALLQSAQEFTMSWPVASRNEFETNLPLAIDQRAQVRIAVAILARSVNMSVVTFMMPPTDHQLTKPARLNGIFVT